MKMTISSESCLGVDFVDSEAYDGDSYDARLSTMTAVLDS